MRDTHVDVGTSINPNGLIRNTTYLKLSTSFLIAVSSKLFQLHIRYFNKQVAANPEQRSVVEHVVGGSSGAAPYLLLGPPGTGKTVTIVEAILQVGTLGLTAFILLT